MVFICLLTTAPAGAQETDHTQLAEEFAQVLGLDKMLLNAKLQAKKSAEQQFLQMMAQFRKSFDSMPEKYMNAFQEAGAEFVRAVSLGWDAAEAARIYTVALADELPENELRKSIAHYRTPEGQNELKAINQAAAQLNAYILTNSQKASQAATNEFIYKIRLIAEKARQERDAKKK